MTTLIITRDYLIKSSKLDKNKKLHLKIESEVSIII